MRDVELDIKNYIKENPITFPQDVSENLGVSRQTASKYLVRLKKSGFLDVVNIGSLRLFIRKGLLEKSEA